MGRASGTTIRPVTLKKIVTLVVTAFVVFAVVEYPTQSATAVQNILGWLANGATAIVTFVHNLFR